MPQQFHPYADEDASPQTGPVGPGPMRKKKAPATKKPRSQWKSQTRGLPAEALQSGLFAANAPRCRPPAAAPAPARPMQEDPPPQRAEQPTPAQDNEPDTPPRPPSKTRPMTKALENLPNLPFPFVKATCRFGATEPTASGRPQRPLQDIVAFGTVKDLADAVDGGKTDVRYGNKYSVAQKLRAAEYSRIHGYDTDEKGTRPPRRPPAPAALAAVRHTRSAARLQAPTTRRSRATP